MGIYDFKVKTIKGEEVSMESFKGKTLLIVNVASKCGFTPQYRGLEDLYEQYKGEGLEVLGFPCNQFGGQEPGGSEEIASFCETTFGVSFPMFEKIEVNGDQAHPLYEYLKGEAPGLLGTKAIKWNFSKFLVSADGSRIERFAPKDSPESLKGKIEEFMAK